MGCTYTVMYLMQSIVRLVSSARLRRSSGHIEYLARQNLGFVETVRVVPEDVKSQAGQGGETGNRICVNVDVDESDKSSSVHAVSLLDHISIVNFSGNWWGSLKDSASKGKPVEVWIDDNNSSGAVIYKSIAGKPLFEVLLIGGFAIAYSGLQFPGLETDTIEGSMLTVWLFGGAVGIVARLIEILIVKRTLSKLNQEY